MHGVGEPAEVVEARRTERDVETQRVPARLPDLTRLQLTELVGVRADRRRDLAQQGSTVPWCQPAPLALVGAPGVTHRAVHQLFVGGKHVGEVTAGRWFEHSEAASVPRQHPLAADERAPLRAEQRTTAIGREDWVERVGHVIP